MNEQEFNELAGELARLNNVDQETAAGWLAAIGDTPMFEEDGRVTLLDDTGTRTGSIIWPEEEF